MWNSTLFDYIGPAGSKETWHRRKAVLAEVFPPHDYTQPPQPNQLYAVCAYEPATKAPAALDRELRQLSGRWGCVFYEGLVAKRTRDPYPVQLRSARQEFAGWVKHRWAY